ncbi:centrosomal protein of 78 kDa [Brachionichthys hirsutus]|uniref:centrosomal protein of 78 kDa n=1 Tax=Brachionichthys hirsutus TaxID=412623 RepID=UPI003605141A
MSSRTKIAEDHTPTWQQGAQDFLTYYDFACARQESVPLPAVKLNLDKGILDFNGDRVKFTDWSPILSAISINKHLHHIAISSANQASLRSGDADRRYYKSNIRKKFPAIRSKDMRFKLCKALRECLTLSPTLKSLQLNGLPLRERDLITLTKGLAKALCLESLSLANCPISDEGLEVICQSVKYSTSIRTVDFTGCNLTWRGVEHMANIIKHQAMQRHGTAWAESLRYQQPQFEGMGGLRRLTLSCNTLIGDRGAAVLAHELAEDLWVKAVDLQRCGLSSEGARRLLEALKTNSTLHVLDIRNNPLVDKVLVKTAIEKVLMNANGRSSQYCWIKPAAKEPQRASGPKRLVPPSASRGNTTFRIDPREKTSPEGRSPGVAKTQKPCSLSRYVPWRAAARAGRQRGMAPGVCVNNQSFQDAATVKITLESDSEGGEEDEEVLVEVEQKPSTLHYQDKITRQHIGHLQMALKECRLQLTEERRARLKAESRVMEFEMENARLRNTNLSLSEALNATGSASAHCASGLEDEVVLQSIENSFSKFHAFLDLLRDAGLGQLPSIAGIDKSDFQSLGRLQLSSTREPYFGSTVSLTRKDLQDVGTKNNCSSFLKQSEVRPAPPWKPADTSRTLPSVRESYQGNMLSDVTVNQASIPTLDPDASDGSKPNRFSKTVAQCDSASECSSHSKHSLDDIYFGKTFQMPLSHSSSKSDSHRSNSSHGGWSERSSVKAESESVSSRVNSKWSLVASNQSGSEGSA